MANIESRLFETAQQLEQMVSVSGKVVPKPGERSNIVENLDYIIELMGTMVTDETFKQAKKIQSQGYNGIADRIDTINYLLASGEISGDVDLEPLTITENGEYLPGAGKGYSRVVVSCPAESGSDDNSRGIIERTITSIENAEVSKVGNYAFYENNNLITASFPSCTDILFSAFLHCYNLTSISFPACTSIWTDAFKWCDRLTTVSFPVCTNIGVGAFRRCERLTSVSFPACTNISDGAFNDCRNLTSVLFPTCTNIGYGAFSDCRSLTSVSFPVCMYIGSSAFRSCYSLTSVSFPVCTNIGGHAFANCSSLMSVIFPACTNVGAGAFTACYNLTTVSIPACTTINMYAFDNCSNLQSIYLQASSLCQLNHPSVFEGISTNYSIYVPSSLYSQYLTAPNWSDISSHLASI